MIHHIDHHEIDLAAWDRCIENAALPLIYARSWYLDIVSPGWDALVKDDHEAVMPLTWNKKMGMRFLQQPKFTQQLGVFTHITDDDLVVDFLNNIPERFRYVDINLNATNALPLHKDYECEQRVNYTLKKNGDYEKVYSGYNQNTRRNLKKALKNNLVLRVLNEPDAIIDLKRKYSTIKLEPDHYSKIRQIMQFALKEKLGQILAIEKEGKIVAAAFFLEYLSRSIYLFSVSSDKAKQWRAMVYLIDHYIKSMPVGSILDFEGSNDPDLAFFFRGFGGKPSYYPNIRSNKLPFPLNVLKK